MKTIVFCLLAASALAAPSQKLTFRRGLNRIFGGQEATPGQFPYQLSFQDTTYGENFYICGASIYNQNWAITAGHCVQGTDMDKPDYLQVVAGDHDMDNDDGTEQKIILSKIIRHEDYGIYEMSNDISLLRLSKPLIFNDYVAPISLQTAKGYLGDCVVSGWGTKEGGQTPSRLQYVEIPTMTDTQCGDSYGQDNIGATDICAGFPEGGKGACLDDAGGPLVCGGLLTGIMSFSWGCGLPDAPGVYTEVAYYKEWVEAHVQ
ncbi:hypothetical protein O3P69_000664 [Scylla paramamosain]|uniref:limulus clotting factor C n=2 Tax=Scylla paramamosain TaxID=85552 RepID=A0AAW0UV15_SCYPA